MTIFNKCKSCKYWYECNDLIINTLNRPPKIKCDDYQQDKEERKDNGT